MARPYPTAKSLENLIPLNTRSKEEQRKIQLKGAKAAQEKYQKNKTVTKMVADFLVENHKVKSGRSLVDMSAEEIIIESIIGNLRAHGTSASVSMLERIKEYTEGTGAGSDGAKKDSDLLSGLLASPNVEENKKDGNE